MKGAEFTLRIDAFRPDTLPMARLAEYLALLAQLMGHQKSIHFDRVGEGSAHLISRVEPQDAPKVERRLAAVLSDTPPTGTAKIFQAIDDLLAEDNAIGQLLGPEGAVVIPFPGRTRPKALTFPAFRQEGALDGQVVNIGGRDRTAHVILQDGPITYSNIDLSRDLARQLAPHLYGPKIRLFGSGRWERHPDGSWKLLTFTVDRHEVLDDAPLSQVLDAIRAVPENGLVRDRQVYDHLMALRIDEGDVH